MTLHTISILVSNEPGVASRIVDVFSAKGYNIESITAAPAVNEPYSRLTIVTKADNTVIEQTCKQLNKLIPVIKVIDLTINEAIECEIVLAKVFVEDIKKPDFLNVINQSGAKIMDATDNIYIVKMSGCEEEIQTFSKLLKSFEIKEFVRSGKIAVSKSNKSFDLKK